MIEALKGALDRVIRQLTRTSAFLRKDIVDFLRQPRLVLALVLGPLIEKENGSRPAEEESDD